MGRTRTYEDDFHKQMVERMQINYYQNGGKERSQYRRLVNKYDINATTIFTDVEELTLPQKIELLQIYSKTQRKPYTKKSDVITD